MAISRSLIFFLGVYVSFTLISLPAKVTAETPLLFTFGDSAYDVGNKKFLSSKLNPATAWPYGQSVDDPTGRWSDGRIVPDFIGELIGNREPIPPVLDSKSDISHGASFAIAGAVVLGSQPETMSFQQQISKFIEIKNQWSDKQRAEAIYMIHIGSDDYLNFAKENPNADIAQQIAHVVYVLQRISKDLVSLYKSGGGRKFAVQNLGPIGCLPIIRQEFKTDESCLEMANFMATTHNQRLKSVLAMMTVPLRSFQYSFFDFNGEILKRINEPSVYGYTDTTNSCCGTGSRHAFGCGYGNIHSNLCSYQRSYLFYDGRHNTEKTNQNVANLFYTGDKNVASPVNIKELVEKSVSYLAAQGI